MGQVLHGSTTTTEAIRRAIQHSEASLRALAKRYGINQKTVTKWKRRTSVKDRPTGPKEARSTVLSLGEEAIVVAFRKHTLLPLDDCLYALQPSLPHLTRSSPHRCLQRHGKAADFFRHLIAAVPYKIHTVLTDNGTTHRLETPARLTQSEPLWTPENCSGPMPSSTPAPRTISTTG